jgi:two-component system, cell cycle response regulator
MNGQPVAVFHRMIQPATSRRGFRAQATNVRFATDGRRELRDIVNSTSKDFKVLIIDDSPVSRKLVELPLAQKQYKLIFAQTGLEAMKLFEEHQPDLVILDWVMPDLTGEELCRRIRSSSRDSYCYIIVLTGNTDKDSLVRALDAGADDHLTKPFHRGELMARVAVGIRTVELHRQLRTKTMLMEKLALTDALTGLPNRRAIETWAEGQLSGAARHKFSCWVVVADLDHFKQVNDTFGHDAGDLVLQKFSKILKTNTRNSDLCGRLGGEEFLMVLTYAAKDDALAVIERIREELDKTVFTFGGCTVRVTASFGLAGFEGHQKPSIFSKLQLLADEALYAAKRAGRNRVELAAAAAC